MTAPRIALATATASWELDDDASLLVDALERRGVMVTPAIWNDPTIDWGSFDLVVIRSTWDYVDHVQGFLAWTRHVDSLTRLANPAGVVAWNIDKRYLGELVEHGVCCVPTEFPTEDELDDVVGAVGVDLDIVVKPTVSAGSRDTVRFEPSQRPQAIEHAQSLLAAGRHVMVQPYIATVDRSGETGMVFLDGHLSHTFRKGPLLTDGHANVEGLFAPEQIEPRTASAAELELAHTVLAVAASCTGDAALMYARVDVLSDDVGDPMLLELELIEPSFFLAHAEGAADRAAAAIVDAV